MSAMSAMSVMSVIERRAQGRRDLSMLPHTHTRTRARLHPHPYFKVKHMESLLFRLEEDQKGQQEH